MYTLTLPRLLRAAFATGCLALATTLPGCEVYLNRSSADQCLGDGMSRAGWTVEFAGGGCVKVATDEAATLAPQPVAVDGDTKAALVVGPSHGASFDLRARMITDSQLRSGTPPNPWEVAWLAWDYSDEAHFYYAILKPNGWEIGKRDPAYPGGQRFLATGRSPSYPTGQWYDLRVVRVQGRTSLTVDGVPIAVFVDPERPYEGGRVALYSEDAAVRFQAVEVRAAPSPRRDG